MTVIVGDDLLQHADTFLQPLDLGGVRELGRDEREALYARCLPQLREAQLERLRTAG